MVAKNLLSDISRQFFKDKNIYGYRMKKVTDMTDEEVIGYCHWFCEENKLTEEFNVFRTKTESQYYYCSYLQDYIYHGCCYDMQMIAGGFIKETVSPEIQIDKAALAEFCSNCRNSL